VRTDEAVSRQLELHSGSGKMVSFYSLLVADHSSRHFSVQASSATSFT
jgi:hypothetical protein